MIDVGDNRDVSPKRIGDIRSGFFEHRHHTSIQTVGSGVPRFRGFRVPVLPAEPRNPATLEPRNAGTNS
jgi:hypothetical protein